MPLFDEVNACELCGEDLPRGTNDYLAGYHIHPDILAMRPVWDSCMRAAQGDHARLIRVHRRMAQTEPLLARAYDGDR